MKLQKLISVFFLIFVNLSIAAEFNYKQTIELLKQQAQDYWLFQSQEQIEKANIIKILESYQTAPAKTDAMPNWIKYRSKFKDANYCFDAYKKQALKDIKLIENSINNHIISDVQIIGLLQKLKEYITESLPAIEQDYEREHIKKQQDKEADLRKQQIQAEMENSRRMTLAQEKIAEEQKKLKIAEENKRDQVTQLVALLSPIDFDRLQLKTEKELEKIQHIINKTKQKQPDLFIEKKNVLDKLTALIKKIKEYREIEKENQRLEDAMHNDEQDINNAKLLINNILDHPTEFNLTSYSPSEERQLLQLNQKLKKEVSVLNKQKNLHSKIIDEILDNSQLTTEHKKRLQEQLQQSLLDHAKTQTAIPVAVPVRPDQPNNLPVAQATVVTPGDIKEDW